MCIKITANTVKIFGAGMSFGGCLIISSGYLIDSYAKAETHPPILEFISGSLLSCAVGAVPGIVVMASGVVSEHTHLHID